LFLALAIGVGVAVASAYSPAREASLVSPVEAMARGGRREYDVRVNKLRDFLACSRARFWRQPQLPALPAVAGKPLFLAI